MMKLEEFLEKLRLAESCKTLYVKGCFGAPMTAKNKQRYTTNLKYNKDRASMINACSSDTFGFDCVCLIKAALGLWNADVNKPYGGTIVNKEANGISFGPDHVPDVGADGIMKYLLNVSMDFSKIVPGAVTHMAGHVGVYVGDGKVIECSPKWSNDVQYSNLGNLGYTIGHWRNWTNWGLLPWVDYNSPANEEKPVNEPSVKPQEVFYTVKGGDTLTKIAKSNGITLATLLRLNPQIKNPNVIYKGQQIRIK